jgi:hypothetical protein
VTLRPDPLLPVPTLAAAEALAARLGQNPADIHKLMCDAREEQIDARKKDPFGHGYVPPIWTVVWSLLDWPWWPLSLEKSALARCGDADLHAFMARMRRALGFPHPVRLLWVSGANRAGKTEMTAYMINAQMAAKPGQRIVPLATSHGASLDSEFQAKLWRYIPHEWRGLGRTASAYISYKEQTGFSDSTYTFPNSSRCSFVFYSQDPESAMEGFDADAIFPDETIPAPFFDRILPRVAGRAGYSVLTNTPQAGYDAVVHQFLSGATVTRWSPAYMLPRDGGAPDPARALGLSPEELAELTADFDARPQRASRIPESRPEDCWRWIEEAEATVKDVKSVNGEYQNTVHDVHAFHGSKEPAPWALAARPLREGGPSVPTPDGRLFESAPRVARCADPDRAVVWFHGADNPFSLPRNLLRNSVSQDRDWTRCRIYGVVSPQTKSVFTMFREAVHVVPESAIPLAGTNYHVMDPAFARNPFMLWIRAVGDAAYVYREFPSLAYPVPEKGVLGPWARISGKKNGANDGERDEGAASVGWGYIRFKNLIARLEGWKSAKDLPPDAPWDPEEEVRLWRDSPEPGDAREIIHRRLMDPRGGSATFVEREGVSTPLLEYARLGMRFESAAGGAITAGVDKVIDALDWAPGKKPRLFICETCKNLIWAFLNWKNIDGEKAATKDPIDCIRYYYTSGCTDCSTLPATPSSRWSASLGRFTASPTSRAPTPTRRALTGRVFR